MSAALQFIDNQLAVHRDRRNILLSAIERQCESEREGKGIFFDRFADLGVQFAMVSKSIDDLGQARRVLVEEIGAGVHVVKSTTAEVSA